MSTTLTISPARALFNLKHMRAMIDEYIALAVKEEIPDAMTPLFHMDRDLRQLVGILEAWVREEQRARLAHWEERADGRGNH